MAKTDSFFIRQRVDGSAALFQQEQIDLGAFVDALGKSVLKIHSVSVCYQDEGAPSSSIGITAAPGVGLMSWQLTTQTQTDIIKPDDKSLVSSGQLYLFNGTGTGGIVTGMDEAINVNAETWKNGYMVAVESMYLGFKQSVQPSTGDLSCTVVLECTVETMTKEGAMALALSQQ